MFLCRHCEEKFSEERNFHSHVCQVLKPAISFSLASAGSTVPAFPLAKRRKSTTPPPPIFSASSQASQAPYLHSSLPLPSGPPPSGLFQNKEFLHSSSSASFPPAAVRPELPLPPPSSDSCADYPDALIAVQNRGAPSDLALTTKHYSGQGGAHYTYYHGTSVLNGAYTYFICPSCFKFYKGKRGCGGSVVQNLVNHFSDCSKQRPSLQANQPRAAVRRKRPLPPPSSESSSSDSDVFSLHSDNNSSSQTSDDSETEGASARPPPPRPSRLHLKQIRPAIQFEIEDYEDLDREDFLEGKHPHYSFPFYKCLLCDEVVWSEQGAEEGKRKMTRHQDTKHYGLN